MAATPNLGLPLVAAAQAQKHVTVNEALFGLDTLVQLAVLDKDLTAPPAGPTEGDRYIVAGPGPTGAWSGWAGRIARFQDGAWISVTPKAGWFAFVADEADLYTYDGAGWTSFRATIAALTTLQNLALLGLGTAADSTNPFAAKLNRALWTAKTAAEGGTGDLRCTLNKEAAAKTLSFLFQTGFSGRAELGLLGDDDLGIKVSADGAAWKTSARVARATGNVGLGTAPDLFAPLVVKADASFGMGLRVQENAAGSSIIQFVDDPITAERASMTVSAANGEFRHSATTFHAFHTSGVERVRIAAAALTPNPDNAMTLGSASARWSAVYAVSGAINTSDGREKKVRGGLSAAELAAWGEVRPLIFQFLDAVAAKGEDGARLHAGFTAQAVAEAFTAHGLDPGRYALWCRDPVLRPVRRTRVVSRPRIETVEIEEPFVAIEEGRAVQHLRRRAVERPVLNRLPVFDESGKPIPGLRHEQPVLERVEEAVEEMQDTGEVRLGLRYEQCLVFEAAYLRAVVAGLQSEVARLTAAAAR